MAARAIIKHFHRFNHRGQGFCIDVEGMRVFAINGDAARALKDATQTPIVSLTPETEQQLRSLELLADPDQALEQAETEVKRISPPVADMALLLTQRCNLECTYCYGDGGTFGTGGKMSSDTAHRAIDWLMEKSGKVKILRIKFLGGEPFLNFSLMREVARYATAKARKLDKRVDFQVVTNGTRLGSEEIAFLKEFGVAVTVSLDGPQQVQDAQRPLKNGSGSWEIIVPRVKALLKALPEASAHAVLVGDTDPRLVRDALQELGFRGQSILPVSRSLFEPQSADATRDRDTQEIDLLMDEEAEDWIRLVKQRNTSAITSLVPSTQFYAGMRFFLHNMKSYFACGAGLGLVAVGRSGDIYLCHRFVGVEDYRLGSVFEKDLAREAYEHSPTTSSEICAPCFAKYYCAGGCKHDNVGYSGSAFVPAEDICRFRRRQLERAAYIVCELDSEDRAYLVDEEFFPPKPCPFDF